MKKPVADATGFYSPTPGHYGRWNVARENSSNDNTPSWFVSSWSKMRRAWLSFGASDVPGWPGDALLLAGALEVASAGDAPLAGGAGGALLGCASSLDCAAFGPGGEVSSAATAP